MKKSEVSLLLVLFCLLYAPDMNAQDYLCLNEGSTLKVNITSVNEDAVRFRMFASNDTNNYFVMKSNAKNIYFNDAVLTEIKRFENGSTWVRNQNNLSEYLFPVDGEKEEIMIDSISHNQVIFRLANKSDKNLYRFEKNKILQITFMDLVQRDAIIKQTTGTNEEMTLKGDLDAHRFYHNYTTAGTFSFIGGITIMYGALIPIVASVTIPRDYNLGYPDAELMKNPLYAASYKQTAKKIKTNRVWLNYGLGALTCITLLFISAAGIH